MLRGVDENEAFVLGVGFQFPFAGVGLGMESQVGDVVGGAFPGDDGVAAGGSIC